MDDNDLSNYLAEQKADQFELDNLPSSINKYLTGIQFPAQKEDILRHAQRNNAPNEILHIISLIEDKTYEVLPSISQELKRHIH